MFCKRHTMDNVLSPSATEPQKRIVVIGVGSSGESVIKQLNIVNIPGLIPININDTFDYRTIQKDIEEADLVLFTLEPTLQNDSTTTHSIIKIAKDAGILIIGVVTNPFCLEENTCFLRAEQTLSVLKNSMDLVIVIFNEQSISFIDPETPICESFQWLDTQLSATILDIVRLTSLEIESIYYPRMDNLADVSRMMNEHGSTIVGWGEATGENAAREAVTKAIASINANEEYSIHNAICVLVHFTVHPEAHFNVNFEANYTKFFEAFRIIHEWIDELVDILSGFTIDPNVPLDFAGVRIYANGFGASRTEYINNLPYPFLEKI